jgi:hypothetical protein
MMDLVTCIIYHIALNTSKELRFGVVCYLLNSLFLPPFFSMQLETQVSQQQHLQGCLEEQLEDVLRDRDRLEEELQKVGEAQLLSGAFY